MFGSATSFKFTQQDVMRIRLLNLNCMDSDGYLMKKPNIDTICVVDRGVEVSGTQLEQARAQCATFELANRELQTQNTLASNKLHNLTQLKNTLQQQYDHLEQQFAIIQAQNITYQCNESNRISDQTDNVETQDTSDEDPSMFTVPLEHNPQQDDNLSDYVILDFIPNE